MALSEENWSYILKHEIAHFYHKDLYIRNKKSSVFNAFIGEV